MMYWHEGHPDVARLFLGFLREFRLALKGRIVNMSYFFQLLIQGILVTHVDELLIV